MVAHIDNKQIVVVGGCGRVGLPLGLVFAATGKANVTLLDISEEKVDQVNGGKLPFMEEGAQELLDKVIGRSLKATVDPSCLSTADCVITVIGTPVDAHQNPTIFQFVQSLDGVISSMKENALLILRSTVYPGVTKLLYDRVKNSGRKINIAFCPERIAEGKALEELINLPQIVSSFEPDAQRLASEIFALIAPEIIELTPLEAELAKLFTNCWRYLNFAISNQFYLVAERNGLDFYKIYDAMTKDYPRMKSFARAGFAAGPCLLKDTLQLSTYAHNNFFLGTSAMLVNESLPNFIVDQLAVNDLSNKTAAVLGMAFKAGSDDPRESLSYKLKKLLSVYCKKVVCTDPYVDDLTLVPLEYALAEADIIILGAPHPEYKNLKFSPDKTVIDIWGLWRNTAQPAKQTAQFVAPVQSLAGTNPKA